jgi:hypothetical protein
MAKVKKQEEFENDVIVMTPGKVKKVLDIIEKAARKDIEIRAAELKDQMFCNFQYKHTVGPNTTNSVSTKSEVPVHHDLVAAFRKLDVHLAVIREEIDANAIPDISDIHPNEGINDTINQFTVTQFKLDGTESAMSVVLIGTKQLSTGDAIKLETPKIAIDDSYQFSTELAFTIQECVSEVEQYMQGKQAENPQQELPFDNSDSIVEEGV